VFCETPFVYDPGLWAAGLQQANWTPARTAAAAQEEF